MRLGGICINHDTIGNAKGVTGRASHIMRKAARFISVWLVRPRAWWFNKVPLSVTLLLLLSDGRPLSVSVGLTFLLVVLTICAVGNYGYAINERYDVAEDERAGRTNAALQLGQGRIGAIILMSAALALAFAFAAGGIATFTLTVAELLLPVLYSVPPVRLKERAWLGVAADGLAAHVYPAFLALLAMRYPLGVGAGLLAGTILWSSAVGLRGILSHQLHTADRDAVAGLATVVHTRGRSAIEGFIIFVLLPIEVLAFIAIVWLCDTGPLLWIAGGLYVASEAFRTLAGGFTVTALRPGGQAYIPFVEESFYKAWGPLVIALDAARSDTLYLAVAAAYYFLFTRHLRSEAARLRLVAGAASRRLRYRR